MSVKRRDKKGRILHDGESQRKDGRYVYTYRVDGKQKAVSSWRLVKTDSVPSGKRECVPLRDLEKEIASGKKKPDAKITVLEQVEKYLATRHDIRPQSKGVYYDTIAILKKFPSIGNKRIDKVLKSDAREWMISLSPERKRATIKNYQSVIRGAYDLAMEDGVIDNNPFDFSLAKKLPDDAQKREALTPEQQKAFFDFMETDKIGQKYYDGFFLLLNTGMRIGEMCGLTIHDLDMRKRVIHVDHQIVYSSRIQPHMMVESTTKTKSGVRDLPMADAVYECCQRILASREKPKVEPVLNGYIGFLFLTGDSKPTAERTWQQRLDSIVKRYNKKHTVPLPHITCHVFRHTYASNMWGMGMDAKTLQYLMGHADISMTLQTYTHTDFDEIRAKVAALDG